MFVVDILLALIMAVLLALLFYFGRSGKAGRWAVGTAYAIGVIFALWLSGVWLTPGGLSIWRAHWFAYAFLIPLIVLVSAILMRHPFLQQPSSDVAPTAPASRADVFAVTVFFSLTALVFVALIGLRYL